MANDAIDFPFFVCQIKTQALRLAVVMRLSANGNRAAKVGLKMPSALN
jgi:hypothetical protein